MPEAKPLLDKAGVTIDEGVTDLAVDGVAFFKSAGTRQWEREAKSRMVV